MFEADPLTTKAEDVLDSMLALKCVGDELYGAIKEIEHQYPELDILYKPITFGEEKLPPSEERN